MDACIVVCLYFSLHKVINYLLIKYVIRIIRQWLLNWSTNSVLVGSLFKDYGSFVR
jgi:hypothetical protein